MLRQIKLFIHVTNACHLGSMTNRICIDLPKEN